MNLQDALIEGKKLIEIGKLNAKDTHRIEEKVLKIEQQLFYELVNIDLNEFMKRDIAVEIRSEIFGENVWFCSDIEMAKQILNDDPGAVCYTADELSKLINLDPSKEFLKKIHNAKSVFEDSRILKTKNLKGDD